MFKKEWMIDMMEQKTILIVDDENMMREAVAPILKSRDIMCSRQKQERRHSAFWKKKRFPL